MVFRVLDYREQPEHTPKLMTIEFVHLPLYLNCDLNKLSRRLHQVILTKRSSNFFFFLKKRAQSVDSRVTHCHSRTRARTLVPPTHAFIFYPLFYSIHVNRQYRESGRFSRTFSISRPCGKHQTPAGPFPTRSSLDPK